MLQVYGLFPFDISEIGIINVNFVKDCPLKFNENEVETFFRIYGGGNFDFSEGGIQKC